MKAKEHLKQLRLLDIKISQRIQEKAEIKESAFGIGGMAADADRVQTSAVGDRLPKAVAAYLDIEMEINGMVDRFIDMKHRIIGEIQSLQDERYIRILFKRYVEFKSFERIAEEMSYSYDHICRLHGNALTEFERCHKMSD